MIFSIDKNIPLLKDTLIRKYEVHEFIGNELTNEDLLKTKTDCLIVRSTIKVNRNLLQNTNVKFVATATAGFDHIDLQYLKENNIKLCIASGANSNSVAEYIIYSILLWIKHRKKSINELTVGIIGYGNIGKKVKIYLDTMGIKTLINDPPLEDDANNHNFFSSLETLINESNIITIHTPLTKAGSYKTLDLINSEILYKIKPGSLLINAARGGIVDETTLLKLKDNIDYIIDVWQNEPDYNTDIAKTAVLATPHIAGHSYEGKLKATEIIVNALNEIYNLNLSKDRIINEIKGNNILEIKDFSNIDTIFSSLHKNRQLYSDQEFLLSLSDNPNKVNMFKQFRDKYPIRRETLFLKNL